MPPLPMFPKDRIPHLVVRLPHLSFLVTDGFIPWIALCLVAVGSTLAVMSGAPAIMVWPVLVRSLVVWLLAVGIVRRAGRARCRGGVAGLGAAHCGYILYGCRGSALRWARQQC